MSASPLSFWLWHAIVSVVAAALVVALAPWLHRACRVSHAARSYWLAAWALAVLPAPLAIALHALAPDTLTSALPTLVPLESLAAAVVPTPMSGTTGASSPWSRIALGILLALYGLGVGTGLWRWGRALSALRRLLRTALPLDPRDLAGGGARDEVARLRAAGIALVTLDVPITPFVLRWPRATIVLPRALLARLDDAQLRLVLRHEHAHLLRRDPHWAVLLRASGVLLWFNPFLRVLEQRVQLAAELACDAAALDPDPQLRRAYASAYLQTLRLSMTAAPPAPAIAFSRHDPGNHKMRIGHIVHGDPRARRRPLRSLVLASVALACGGTIVAVHAATGATPRGVDFSGPIIEGRISSGYGKVRASVGPRPHNGVDLTNARGTPVSAPAAGTVLVATAHHAPNPDYGTVIVIDHGAGWQTVYAHLDGLDVIAGEHVDAGQQIGRLGSTGKATGPHVHVEVHHHGERIDPASVIATLVATR